MYPTIVVVLVETQRSMVDICEIGPSSAGRSAGAVVSDHEAHAAGLGHHHSECAVGPINSTMDNEAESSPCSALRQDMQKRRLEKVILEKSRVNTC